MNKPIAIETGAVVRLRKPHPCGGYEWTRKPHPCGGYEWTVVRLGADIGIECNTCQKRVLLPRREFEKRLKKILSSPTSTPKKFYHPPRQPLKEFEECHLLLKS